MIGEYGPLTRMLLKNILRTEEHADDQHFPQCHIPLEIH